MSYETDAASSHNSPHKAEPVKPAQASLWDDPAASFAPPDGAAVILYARPHQQFWVGGPILANEFGEISVTNPETARGLLCAGCRAAPAS